MKLIYKLPLIGLVILNSAFAQDVAGTDALVQYFGTQDAMDATLKCDVDLMGGDAGGNLAAVNMIPCLINLQTNISGTTRPEGLTTKLSFGKTSFSAHIIIDKKNNTIDGIAYDYEMKMWICESNCKTASDFYPAIWQAFSADAKKVVNRGVLVNNFDAGAGNFIGANFIRWNTGTGVSTRKIESVQAECDSGSGVDTRFMSYIRDINSGLLQFSVVRGDESIQTGSTQISLDTKKNEGSISINASGGTQFMRKAATVVIDGVNRKDYEYPVGGSHSPSYLALPTYTTTAFPTVECAGGKVTKGIKNGTIEGLGRGEGVLKTPLSKEMNGMTLHPDKIF